MEEQREEAIEKSTKEAIPKQKSKEEPHRTKAQAEMDKGDKKYGEKHRRQPNDSSCQRPEEK